MAESMQERLILLVEDDRGLAQLIQYICDDMRLSVVHVTSGREAVAWLRAQQPALMLLDYSLPDMNGAALLTLLDESRITAPPFIVTTGAGDERIAVEMMRRGARDYVVKDAQFLEVLPNVAQRVLRVLATERQLAEAQEALRRLNQELERRVEERTAELSATNAALERASRMKDQFLASVSHELRTPLTGIIGFAEGLQEQVPGLLNERQLRYVQSIHSSGRQLLELINGILDFSALEAGQVETQIDPCLLEDICSGSLEMVRSLAEKKNIEITYTRHPHHLVLLTDGRRLKQILMNLLSNAVKFTPEGGAVGLGIVADAEEQICRLTVWDTGIGIAAGDQAQVFLPFVQLDNRLARQYSGTGLGLALVLRMINLLGGSVTVESAPGQGSRFTVALPWRASGAPDGMPGTVMIDDSGERPRVLLAEDVVSTATADADLLARLGCNVTVAHRSEDALLLARELAPAVIVASLQLPGADDLALGRRIRSSSDPVLAATPLILTSALVLAGDAARAQAAGATAYLPKPLGVVTLYRTLLECLDATPA